MKLTYQSRTGHEKYRSVKKNSNGFAKLRRQTALENLEKQLKTKLKTVKNGSKQPLTDKDIERINKEISILKQRI